MFQRGKVEPFEGAAFQDFRGVTQFLLCHVRNELDQAQLLKWSF
jgi:hypothetical protein